MVTVSRESTANQEPERKDVFRVWGLICDWCFMWGCLGWLRSEGHSPERGCYFIGFVFGSGVNRGWGSGLINEFENSTKGIIFVKNRLWVQR